MIGQIIGHYTITAKLGAGGMGEVYLAEDARLKRRVALKFLPAHFSRDPDARARFQREAEALAGLNHPNIVTVFDVAAHESRPYIAMEYVEGQSLKNLAGSGDVDVDRVIEIASQIADGLAAAHKADVVHRDIKSDNIIVTAEGRVKVMDFGLATWRGAAQLTREGSTVGTMAYMSPEQAQGRDLDRRTDLWSLGVIIYEMVTRQLPFAGDHEAAIAYAITNEAPHPLARYSKNVPDGLQRVMDKSLAKDRTERYQSAAELIADLRALRRHITAGGPALQSPARRRAKLVATLLVLGVAVIAAAAAFLPRFLDTSESDVTPERKMLAVLPFENLGAEEDEYFADGITEEITARLAGISDLGVIARTSILQYKGTQKSVQTIGQELGVDYIIEGTIRWEKSPDAPDRVRVTPQLIDVVDATHLWADVYDEVLTGVFQVQADIAQKVVDALNLTLLESERTAVGRIPTDNLQAYDYYLQANGYFNQGFYVERPMRMAQQLYQRAVDLDTQFVEAYARLGRSCVELYWHQDRQDEDLERAKAAIDRAIELGPDLPGPLLALSCYHYHFGNYDQALVELEAVRARYPNNSDLLAEIGYVYRRQNRPDQAARALTQALVLDPHSPAKLGALADTYARMRRYEEALQHYDRIVALVPGDGGRYAQKAWICLMRDGDAGAAEALIDAAAPVVAFAEASAHGAGLIHLAADNLESALQRFAIENPRLPCAELVYSAYTHSLLGHTPTAQRLYDSARTLLEQRITAKPDDDRYHCVLSIAYAGLGRKTDALREVDTFVALAPLRPSKAVWDPSFLMMNSVAWTYVMVGEYDKAIDQIEFLLSMPTLFSTHTLRIMPMWKPLQDHPRFQALLAKYE